jgi:hypothetical protein
MNIKQALKRKNQLVGLISEQYSRANTYNSVEVGTVRPYDPKESLTEWFKLTTELVDLKTKIHTANLPVYYKIFHLSELKSQVKYLKALTCTEGKERNRWDSENPVSKVAMIGVVERDNLVKDLETQIESIQEELDYHNQNTNI